MRSSSVRVERSGRIAVVRLETGDGRNLMSRQVMADLTAAARGFEDDWETSAIVLTGGAQVFSLGYDLDTAGRSDASLAEQRQMQALGPRMCRGVGGAGASHRLRDRRLVRGRRSRVVGGS